MKKVYFVILFSFLFFPSYDTLSEINDENWTVFNQVYVLVKESHVEGKKSSEIILGALKGLAKATGPESGYVTKEKYALIEEAKEMEYQLPFYITKEDGFARVIAPFGGKDFGVEVGDVLKSINGTAIFDLSYPQTIVEMKKSNELELNCSFMKKGTLKVFEKKIRAAKYESPSIIKIDERTAVLKIPCLEVEIPKNIKESLMNISKVILDLRFCASDDIESAIKWAGFLFGKGEVKVSSKEGVSKIEFDGEGILSNTNCYILMDSTTARGGEVLVLVGGQKFKTAGSDSFGFAAKHQILTMKNGDKLIILKGYFLDKNGEEIKDKPIKPDIVIDDLPKEMDKKSYNEILKKLN